MPPIFQEYWIHLSRIVITHGYTVQVTLKTFFYKAFTTTIHPVVKIELIVILQEAFRSYGIILNIEAFPAIFRITG